jgi:hypothetical protein
MNVKGPVLVDLKRAFSEWKRLPRRTPILSGSQILFGIKVFSALKNPFSCPCIVFSLSSLGVLGGLAVHFIRACLE